MNNDVANKVDGTKFKRTMTQLPLQKKTIHFAEYETRKTSRRNRHLALTDFCIIFILFKHLLSMELCIN